VLLLWHRERDATGRVRWSLRREDGREVAHVALSDGGRHRAFRASWHGLRGAPAWWVQRGTMASAKTSLERWMHRYCRAWGGADLHIREAASWSPSRRSRPSSSPTARFGPWSVSRDGSSGWSG